MDIQSTETLDHLTIKVPDLACFSRFYQYVLGMPLLRSERDTRYLSVGDGFLGIQLRRWTMPANKPARLKPAHP